MLPLFLTQGVMMALESLGSVISAGIEAVGLNRNWKPIPLESERKDGHIWTHGKWKDEVSGEKITYLKHAVTGNLFVNDSQDWALARNIGALVVGKYVYGAAFFGHAAKGALETAQKLHAAWGTFQAMKGEDGFNLSTFAQNELGNFKAAGEHFMQAAKYGAVAGALWWDPAIFGLGIFGLGTMRTALGGYALFKPIGFRSEVHKVDSWCRPANIGIPSDERVKGLSAWNAVAEGALPLARMLNMHCVGNIHETYDGVESPRFTLVADDKEEVERKKEK